MPPRRRITPSQGFWRPTPGAVSHTFGDYNAAFRYYGLRREYSARSIQRRYRARLRLRELAAHRIQRNARRHRFRVVEQERLRRHRQIDPFQELPPNAVGRVASYLGSPGRSELRRR